MHKPSIWVVAALAIIFCISAAHSESPEPPAVLTPVSGEAADTVVERRLDQKIGGMDFNQVPLKDALARLQKESGVPFVIHWGSMEGGGVKPDHPVDLHLPAMSLRLALRQLLFVAGRFKLSFAVHDGLLIISSPDDLSTSAFVRVYDVRDLVVPRRPFIAPPSIGDWQWQQVVPKVEPDGILGERTVTYASIGEQSQEESDNALMNMIKSHVAPDSWANTNLFNITIRNGNLVVSQTYAVHHEIRDLLARLRMNRWAGSIPMGVATVRLNSDKARAELIDGLSKGGDLLTLLRQGERAGKWTLDRCGLEAAEIGHQIVFWSYSTDTVISEVYGADGGASSKPASTRPDSSVSAMTIAGGHSVDIRIQPGAGEKVIARVQTGSGWSDHEKRHKAGPSEITLPQYTVGYDIKQVSLAPGEYRHFDLAPSQARGGGLVLVVWRPANPATKP